MLANHRTRRASSVAATLPVIQAPSVPHGPLHVLIDSTGRPFLVEGARKSRLVGGRHRLRGSSAVTTHLVDMSWRIGGGAGRTEAGRVALTAAISLWSPASSANTHGLTPAANRVIHWWMGRAWNPHDMTREVAEFAYDLHTGLASNQIPEFDDL